MSLLNEPAIDAAADRARAVLRQVFGYDSFRGQQEEIIGHVIGGGDCLVLMPTGGGKSLCFQIPALVRPGTAIVVSPLIALMKDQVDALRQAGLRAAALNSSLGMGEAAAIERAMRNGELDLVYVAPERLVTPRCLELLADIEIALFAIDEAHCVSHWGHDFRPDYLRLKQAVQSIGRPQMIALTATATPHVRTDISVQLGMKSPLAFVSGFDRPNLRINVINSDKETDKIRHIKLLANSKGSGIIYTSTRKTVDQVAVKLRSAGVNIVAYHAGNSEDERSRAQDQFMSGKAQVIVATNAFGMGIDKPDIRFVAHFQMPGSIEAYYQEIGRAGRDGLPSTCSLLFNYADKRTQDYFIEGSFPTPETITRVYQTLAATGQKRIELSTAEIAARSGIRNEMSINSALIILDKAGHIERSSAAENRSSLRLNIQPAAAREGVGNRDSNARQVLFALMNTYELNQRTSIDLDIAAFASELGVDLPSTRKALSTLASSGILSYEPARRSRGVVMLDDAPVSQLRVKQAELARRAALEQRKLRDMISFCYTDTCYRAFILDYFGDKHHGQRCGTCGNCQTSGQGFRSTGNRSPAGNSRSGLDDFVVSNRPTGIELEAELAESSRRRRESDESLARANSRGQTLDVRRPRPLSTDETLIVRKILACAVRMEGRYGKNIMAATLIGSEAKNIFQFRLDKLSTYGILSDFTKDELLVYIEALVMAGALEVSTGAYPVISATALGRDVMHERQQIDLSLAHPDNPRSNPVAKASSRASHTASASIRGGTIDETYKLFRQGLSIEEIAQRRTLSPITIEGHLEQCIVDGRDFPVEDYVSPGDRKLIDSAIAEHGTALLKPLRLALPENITYRMIRFVVAAERHRNG